MSRGPLVRVRTRARTLTAAGLVGVVPPAGQAHAAGLVLAAGQTLAAGLALAAGQTLTAALALAAALAPSPTLANTSRVEIGDGWGRPQYETSPNLSAGLAAGDLGPVVAFLVVRDGQVVFEHYAPRTQSPNIQVHRNTPLDLEDALLPLVSTVAGAAFLHGHVLSTDHIAPVSGHGRDQRIRNLEVVLETNTREPLTNYAQRVLFQPLGIHNYSWSGAVAPRGLRMTARDMAKVGQVYLDEGVWQSHRVLPAWWPREAFRTRKELGGGWAVGFDWYIHGSVPDQAGVTATKGNVIWAVLPEHRLVAVVVADKELQADRVIRHVLEFRQTELRR